MTTQAEQSRTAKQLLLRLTPQVITKLRALAKKRGATMSAIVSRFVMRAVLLLSLLTAACSSPSSPATPDATQAISTECERENACTSPGNEPVSAAFCEQEAAQITKAKEQTCDQATLDSCAKANAANDCDAVHANNGAPGGVCGDCWK